MGDICGSLREQRDTFCFFGKYQDFMIFLILLMLFQPSTAEARSVTSADDALVCLNATVQAEEKYQIKKDLLTSISNVETGRWNEKLAKKVAWPWTVNVNGKGYFYSSKKEAVAAVKDWRRRGYRSIDVGCMQINLRFHGKKFASLDDAFEPSKNVDVAAKLLKSRYVVRKDWMLAAADYHSRNHKKAQVYMKKLLLAMNSIKPAEPEKTVTYASNFMITKDTRGWLSKLFSQNKKRRELKISMRE